MRKIPFVLVLFCAATAGAQSTTPASNAPPAAAAATPATSSDNAGAAKARAALHAMVQALGGDRWLNLENTYTTGRIAAFYEGKPTGATIQYWDWKTPTMERLDMDEKSHDQHNWVQIFTPKACWEVTYRGIRPMPKISENSDPCGDAIRRHDHSIEMAVKVWMKDPTTVLLYEGRSMVERRMAEQVTLLNANDDSITILMDAETHLPLRRTYYWRDPVYKDKDQEDEEYDDYHMVDGLPTPFSITRLQNGDMTLQRYVFKASYNVALPADIFNLDAIAAKIRH
ncbi:MAG TPA: hypothetical protein VMD92_09040 [Acidobacteriaceae bacterium]|jgi:hypothetical protein|nr:hypothetical protein [Acidobacteriaceae bacterium]